jgi:acetylornithine deacetylase/succinyl-diaminopimelate desuccinylase-like protein
VVADDEVSIKTTEEPLAGPASPIRADLFNAITDSSNKIWPGVPVVPMMVMGATDGKYLRIAGIPTYGVQGVFFDRNDIRFHGRDERVPVASFYESQAFLYDLVKRLSQ